MFSRVGRGIELTTAGRMFLREARETLARARAAELALGELGGLRRGRIDEPALSATRIATDELVIVVPADHVIARSSGRAATKRLAHLRWILREPGSGTRTAFEHALRTLQIEPEQLNLALTLPSNEAILTAVLSGQYATALSRAVVAPLIASGRLKALNIALPPRDFVLLRHPERHLSSAARELQTLCSNARAG